MVRAFIPFVFFAMARSSESNAPPIAAAEKTSSDKRTADASLHNAAMIADGFNTTRRLFITEKKLSTLELLVLPSDAEHTLRVWGEAETGVLKVRVLSPDGEAILSWQGRRGEKTVERALAAGKYTVEIDARTAQGALAVIGVKGPVVSQCPVDAARMLEHEAKPAKGFGWPYLVYVPTNVRAANALVVPNNTGFNTDDLVVLRAQGACEIASYAKTAEALGVVTIVPLFPRPAANGGESNLYLHALTRSALATKEVAFKRVDLQLLAMLDDARSMFATRGIEISEKVLLAGFSASGSFVNRFALLHPERVRAVASGSPGGWPTVPVSSDGQDALPYPIGIADLQALVGKPLDSKALKTVSWLFFMGDQDRNDAVVYRDSFSKTDEALIFRRFGPTPLSRWDHAQRLYASQKLDAQFKLYPGVAHNVTPDMVRDIEAFFANAMIEK